MSEEMTHTLWEIQLHVAFRAKVDRGLYTWLPQMGECYSIFSVERLVEVPDRSVAFRDGVVETALVGNNERVVTDISYLPADQPTEKGWYGWCAPTGTEGEYFELKITFFELELRLNIPYFVTVVINTKKAGRFEVGTDKLVVSFKATDIVDIVSQTFEHSPLPDDQAVIVSSCVAIFRKAVEREQLTLHFHLKCKGVRPNDLLAFTVGLVTTYVFTKFSGVLSFREGDLVPTFPEVVRDRAALFKRRRLLGREK